MAKAPPSAKRERIKAFTPALVDYTNDVIYGDLWERKALSKRDRSLITVATLVALYRTNELPFHLKRALDNGVTREELIEMGAITEEDFDAAAAIAEKLFDFGRQRALERGLILVDTKYEMGTKPSGEIVVERGHAPSGGGRACPGDFASPPRA